MLPPRCSHLGAAIATLAERFDHRLRTSVLWKAGAGERHSSLGEVVEMMRAEGREPRALFEYWAPTTKPLGEGGDMHFAFSFAAQAAEVEVDIRTGEVRVLRIVAANDVGKAINPLGLQGQVEGGIMMGLGNALTEQFIVEEGMVVTDRLARYRMPSIVHTPEIISMIVEHPTTDGPYGAKGWKTAAFQPFRDYNAIYNGMVARYCCAEQIIRHHP
jgi:xanthine dehydrogenase molybdenum-binding subunit